MPATGENIAVLIVVATLGVFLLVLLMIVLHSRQQNRILSQQRKMTEEDIRHQRELTQAFVISQEQERKRIGMDLHDQVGTALSSLRMLFEGAGSEGDEVARLPTLRSDGKKIIDRVIQQVRYISHDLSPFLKGAYGIKEALEDIVEHIHKSGRMEAVLDLGERDLGFLSEDAQLALYRVLSELVQNTLKHAGATWLRILFRWEEAHLLIRYEDNGKGIDTSVQNKGMGLLNIETRLRQIGAGYSMERPLSDEGRPKWGAGRGFCLAIRVPYKE